MQDEGFHEIQLNGKQLVFLFMAVTVAAVVIFLCGVMVGRGVATERAAADQEVPSQTGIEEDPTALPDLPVPAGGPTTEPGAENGDVTYGGLEDPTPPSESLKSAPLESLKLPQEDAPSGPSPAVRAARASSTAPVVQPPDVRFKEPAGQGFVVQVAALRQRAEAEAMARRLSAKGYQTFVTTSGAHYRVRVGKYNDRAAARAIASRLEREEHFKPWITQ